MPSLPVDIDSFIMPAKEDVKVYSAADALKNKVHEPVNTVGYTSKDGYRECNHEIKEGVENPDCYAKKVTYEDNREKYFVKIGNSGFMYDPWSPYSEGSEHAHARMYGRSAWRFNEVNKKCFDLYVKFLQTKNRAWKINAERELTNA